MTSRKRSSDSQGLGTDIATHTKKTKVTQGEATPGKVDANGDRYWEISKQRRVTISSFRGKTLVNVREYYEKDGQELPGKKVSQALILAASSHGKALGSMLTSILAGDFYASRSICSPGQAFTHH